MKNPVQTPAKNSVKNHLKNDAYLRYPSVAGSRLAFVTDDDIWTCDLRDLKAHRLTSRPSGLAQIWISPDGQWIAYTGSEEGSAEIYVIPYDGGESRRLTFTGAGVFNQVSGWSADGRSIFFTTNKARPFARPNFMYKVSVEGGEAVSLNVGPAHDISFAPNGKASVLGRNTSRASRDYSHWKRYRGGTAGHLWIDTVGKGDFKRFLSKIQGFVDCPMWIGDRIYFLSDFEGSGNLYSVLPSGAGLKRLTDFSDRYLRQATTDGDTIVMMGGGELFAYDVDSASVAHLEVQVTPTRPQRARKFVQTSDWLTECDVTAGGTKLALISRGKPVVMSPFDGPALQLGDAQGVRYRSISWLNDKKHFVVVSDGVGEERLEIHSLVPGEEPVELDFDIGLVRELKMSPKHDELIFSNHRAELWHVDIKKKKPTLLDRSEQLYGIKGIDWSPDGKWIAYAWSDTPDTTLVKVISASDRKPHVVTKPGFSNLAPSFDKDGKYLFFVSLRNFDPVYDSTFFELSFPGGYQPFCLVLARDTASPFGPKLASIVNDAAVESKDKKDEKKDDKKSDKKEIVCTIDFDGIEDRLQAFPLKSSQYNYYSVKGADGSAIFVKFPIEGSLSQVWLGETDAKGIAEIWNFEEQRLDVLDGRYHFVSITPDKSHVLLGGHKKLRLLPSKTVFSSKGKLDAETKPGKPSGWIDLARGKIEVVPAQEWEQMLVEAWRLQREYFWDEKMSGIDWNAVLKRYLPRIDMISTRAELSDLIWEMIGELGTSHAYEFMGDYRRGPSYPQGQLGADFAWSEKDAGYVISKMVRGDSWESGSTSPLATPGLGLAEGDVVVSVGGVELSFEKTPEECLVGLGGQEVLLGVKSKSKADKKIRYVSVKSLNDDRAGRYRDWVEKNRRYVHQKSAGKLGYIHIPNMGPLGFSEYHRGFLAEAAREGLVIDVRCNGGGHVSQLLLEKLARKRLGYDLTRWGQAAPYPSHSVPGPIVAVTDEHAGSDGDIFSHCFKLMKLGTLVGKRTWGGVVGIWPQHSLVDGAVTTQPQFSFWFHDVGWGVENYGTDPDVDVDIAPQDYRRGVDPQLDTALANPLKCPICQSGLI